MTEVIGLLKWLSDFTSELVELLVYDAEDRDMLANEPELN